MKRLEKNYPVLFFYIVFLFTLSTSNPLETTQFNEIQIVDKSHFTIEFDAPLASYNPVSYPENVDSIFLYCSPQNSFPPADSMIKCTQPIPVDTNGIALITGKQFPNFLLKPGNYLFFKYKQHSFHPFSIPATLTRTMTFISGYTDPVCCEYMGECVMYCRSLTYKETPCPSLGINNKKAAVQISGEIKDTKNNFITNANLNCIHGTEIDRYTIVNGVFSYTFMDCSNKYRLQLKSSNDDFLADTTIGPFSMGTKLSITFKVAYTSIHQQRSVNKPAATRILSASTTKGIIFTISETAVPQGVIQVFSNDGTLIKRLPFNCHGAGTYTVNWDGKNNRNRPVPKGTYTLRILLGRQSLCSSILNF